MKTFALAALTLVLCAGAVHAEERAARSAPVEGRWREAAEAPLGRDGQDSRQRCSSQNPNIEYRDCVNASTRDPNAKVRLG